MHFFKATHTCLHTAGAGDEEAAAAAAAAIGQAAAQAGVMPEQGVLRVENGFPIVSPEAGVLACVCAFVRACFFSQPRVLRLRACVRCQGLLSSILWAACAEYKMSCLSSRV